MVPKGKTVTILVSAAIICILVAALLTSISEESQKKTTYTLKTGEVFNLASVKQFSDNICGNSSCQKTLSQAPTGWKADSDGGCPISGFVFRNASTTFTLNTDYNITLATGKIYFRNTSALLTSPNTTYYDYYYCGDDYINTSWGRSLLNLVPGLIALALLVAVIAAVYLLLGKQEED